MTKEEFMKYEGTLHCKNCNCNVPKIHIDYRKVYKNGDISRCNVCEWIKRHNGIPLIDGFTKDEIKYSLYFLIYEQSQYLNDLANDLNKTIDEIIDLFHALKIGNKHCVVKSNCECCGKEIENFPKVYEKTKDLYCSLECYWEDKPNKINHGENSKFYNRITTTCTNCGKQIKVIPSNYNIENSYGDRHNFCSKECYWEYRSKYYIGEKSTMIHHQYTEEQRENFRLNALKNSRNSKRFDSSIQLKINDILDKNNIQYEREYIIEYYAIDNYLLESNLIIEVMGDYWHGSPLKYNKDNYLLSDIQQKLL